MVSEALRTKKKKNLINLYLNNLHRAFHGLVKLYGNMTECLLSVYTHIFFDSSSL